MGILQETNAISAVTSSKKEQDQINDPLFGTIRRTIRAHLTCNYDAKTTDEIGSSITSVEKGINDALLSRVASNLIR